MENESNALVDLIQNISKSLNNNNNEAIIHNEVQNTSQNNDFNIMDILGSLGNISKSPKSNNNTSNLFDVSNVMKMQKIISALSSEDSRKNLLITIKPFLRKSRQSKIDEYMVYLSVITAIGAFDDKKE